MLLHVPTPGRPRHGFIHPKQHPVVATADPQNPDIAREVAAATSLKVELAVAYEVYIARTIVRYFGGEGVPKREEAVKGAA